jgi:hypothetical protein
VELTPLVSPFSGQEILKALKQIPRDKSPGPDGFGSAFLQDFWNTIKPDIVELFSEFYNNEACLDRNNRSFIILIKKKEDSCTPDAYHPISLLNCMVKLITKVLAARLQNHLPKLIDEDQTGFVKSRCIADNFIYALDLVQCCKIRKKKALVLKLDFRKAFDTVSWDFLFKILRIRRFDQKWIDYIQSLTKMAKTAILLNGTPSPWINIKRGLRQGDPLSPLLFLLVVDVLQQIIKCFSIEGHLLHPIAPSSPCPVIQYADDTLIIIQGFPDQARLLKEILEVFSTSTGLAINYMKSNLAPLNLDLEEQSLISSILDCPIATFPQTYLGLPLSDSKLPRWALFPLLQSLDNKVDTLSLKGGSSGGRLTLTKSILSAMPSHILACIKAPRWFYKEIDKRRRGYFWTSNNSALGGQCKIA